MILKISIHQENIIVLNVYDLNNRDSKYTKTNKLQKEIDKPVLQILKYFIKCNLKYFTNVQCTVAMTGTSVSRTEKENEI